jgi:quercetin dioxygenase-like cupin family protein
VDGTAEGELGGTRVSLPAGNAVFVPASVDHRWWNETDKPAEAIIVMFGEGA